ncbi:hypothetical protein [Micromonospora orduensis]|uniref:hypothetical protein n=1 Tax=Micromonospora orduensis TaxID=1420891 RepID=UPI0034018A7F
MTRTVKVDLVLENMRYVRGARESVRATDDVTDSVDGLGKASEKTSRDTDRLGGEMSDLAADARRLDAQIDETARGIRELAREIAHTSDAAQRAKLTEKLAGEQGNLRDQTSLRKLIDFTDIGDVKGEGVRYGARFAEGLATGLARAGGPISNAMSSVFGGLPPQAQAAIGAGVVGAVAATGPLIGGVLSAAVVGAAGAGGIVGGVAVAAQHPAVQAAAKLTGDTLKSEMQRGAVSFVPATVEALGVVRSEIGGIGEAWERASSAASTMLVPLTRDVLGGAESAVEGFATAVERSGPVVDVLGDIVQDAGRLIGDMFADLSENAYEGSRALAALWGVFAGGVRIIVGTISALTEAYGLMEKIGALLVGNRDKFAQLITEEQNAKSSGDGLSEGLQELINGFSQTESTAAAATVEVESLSEAIRRMAGENITAEQANIRLEEAIDRATEAGRKNNDGISVNTEKGRANRQALIGIAEAANASADAIWIQTGSQELASAATDRGRAKFLEAARAMGVSKDEARKLADQLFGIPASRSTTVTVNTGQAEAAVSRIKGRLSEISRRIGVDVVVNARYASYGGGKGTGSGYSTGQRWGGVTEYAQSGLLRDASVFNPVAAGARYGFAEPATGGEAFIPKRGDTDRSRAIWEYVGRNWLGAQPSSPTVVAVGAGAATGNTQVNLNVNVPPGANKAEVGREVADVLSAYFDRGGTLKVRSS